MYAAQPPPPPPTSRHRTKDQTKAAAAAEERHNSRDVRLWALHSCSRCSTSRCHVDCSNRGICDHGTGVCRCFDGYHGQVRRKKRPRPTGSVAVGRYVSRKGLERPQIRMFREQSMRASAESRRYKSAGYKLHLSTRRARSSRCLWVDTTCLPVSGRHARLTSVFHSRLSSIHRRAARSTETGTASTPTGCRQCYKRVGRKVGFSYVCNLVRPGGGVDRGMVQRRKKRISLNDAVGS